MKKSIISIALVIGLVFAGAPLMAANTDNQNVTITVNEIFDFSITTDPDLTTAGTPLVPTGLGDPLTYGHANAASNNATRYQLAHNKVSGLGTGKVTALANVVPGGDPNGLYLFVELEDASAGSSSGENLIINNVVLAAVDALTNVPAGTYSNRFIKYEAGIANIGTANVGAQDFNVVLTAIAE